MTGPRLEEWNPIPAALKWKAVSKRRIKIAHTTASCFQVMDSVTRETVILSLVMNEKLCQLSTITNVYIL